MLDSAKFEIRNSKHETDGKSGNRKCFKQMPGIGWLGFAFSVIRICFGFRVSNFEFRISCFPLCGSLSCFPGFLRGIYLFPKLESAHIRVESALCEELVVRADLHDAALIEDYYLVRALHG